MVVIWFHLSTGLIYQIFGLRRVFRLPHQKSLLLKAVSFAQLDFETRPSATKWDNFTKWYSLKTWKKKTKTFTCTEMLELDCPAWINDHWVQGHVARYRKEDESRFLWGKMPELWNSSQNKAKMTSAKSILAPTKTWFKKACFTCSAHLLSVFAKQQCERQSISVKRHTHTQKWICIGMGQREILSHFFWQPYYIGDVYTRKLAPAPASFAPGWLLNFVSRSHADYLILLVAFVLVQVNREAFFVPKIFLAQYRSSDALMGNFLVFP